MKIEILGMGCPKCKKLTENAETAVKKMGIKAEIVKVTKLQDIMNYGVMLTPALVVNGKVESSGKVLSVEEIENILSAFLKQDA